MFFSHDLLGKKSPLGAIWWVGGGAGRGQLSSRLPAAPWPRAALMELTRMAAVSYRFAAHGRKLNKKKVLEVDISNSWCVRCISVGAAARRG